MAANQQFCLRWNNHQSTLISVFDTLLESGTLVDCTLAAEGQSLKAHKVVLSACSPYLESLLSQHYEKHPILILKDVTFTELKAMLDYMYRGEVNICQDQLGQFLKAAESLQIKGLTDNSSSNNSNSSCNDLIPPAPRKIDTPPRKLVNPYSKSPLFPQGLVVEPRPKINNNNNSTTNNNNDCSVPSKPGSDGGSSPKRKRRRKSLDDLSSEGLYATSEPLGPECLVKTEPKFEDVNNDVNSGDELPCDADDEEELDLSRPGTSQSAHNSLQPGWNASGENAADDMFPPGQHDPGSGRKYEYISPMRLSWDLWATMPQAILKTGVNNQSTNFTSPTGGGGGSVSSGGNSSGDGVECSQCGRHYKLKSSLRNHQKWECGKEPQFQCPYCNYRAKQKMHVVRHIERMHREKLDLLEQESSIASPSGAGGAEQTSTPPPSVPQSTAQLKDESRGQQVVP